MIDNILEQHKAFLPIVSFMTIQSSGYYTDWSVLLGIITIDVKK